MPEALFRPALLLGVMMAAACLGAALARRLRLPTAVGAVSGGLALCLLMTEEQSGAILIAQGPLFLPLTCWVGILCGAQLDLPGMMRHRRSILFLCVGGALAILLASAAFGGISRLLGASLSGFGAAAGAPLAIGCVMAEARASGAASQRLLSAASVGAGLAMLLEPAWLAASPTAYARAAGPVLGALAGLVMIVPLSRATGRATVVVCTAACSLLLAAALPDGGFLPAQAAALIAGFVVATLAPNRELIRDALRDLAVPLGIALFGGMGVLGGRELAPAAVLASLLFILAKLGGLFLASRIMPASGPSWLWLAMLPAWSPVDALSQAAAMLLCRRALRRGGEAASVEDDPDAWRAGLR